VQSLHLLDASFDPVSARARWLASLGLLAIAACDAASPAADGGGRELMSTPQASGTTTDDPECTDSGTSTGPASEGGESAGSSDGDASTGTSGAEPECDTETTTGSPQPVCGDGIVEGLEACDDGDQTQSCDGDCTLPVCGDGVVNDRAGESCEGADLVGTTCVLLGLPAGSLACTAGCGFDTSGCGAAPGVPELTLSFSPIDRFDFAWPAVAGADHYQLEESETPGAPLRPLGGDVLATSISHEQPLHLRREASYRLQACNPAGCTASGTVDVTSSLAEAVGYFKAWNPAVGDEFGARVAISADGSTLAVAAHYQDDPGPDAGAVYVFVRDGLGTWSQQAYLHASNAGANDVFGQGLSLSADGSVLAVGAPEEDGGSTGIGGDEASNTASDSGAVYVFVRDGLGAWSQEAYVKASNTQTGDHFGASLSLSADGDALVVGAYLEDGAIAGIGGDQGSNAASNAGAIYVYVRNGVGAWVQEAYVKASNPNAGDFFGQSVALAGDGDTFVVGAYQEDGNATGIGGNQASNTAMNAGAAYVFARSGMGAWVQQAYVKASNTGGSDWFGIRVAISHDGDTVAVGAFQEDSSATGIGGDPLSNTASASGAAYVFERSGMDVWSQQAYVKASNTQTNDFFGYGLALSGDGDVLAVGSLFEAGGSTGIGGDQADEGTASAGAVYAFVRDGMGAWSQRSYVKAPNTDSGDAFGASLSLSADGHVLAVGAYPESSGAAGVGGDQADDSVGGSGAVYLY
jgi:hypothetical protein